MTTGRRSLIGTVAAVTVAASAALVGVTATSASSAPERAVKKETTVSIRVDDRRVDPGETTMVRGNLDIEGSGGEAGTVLTLEARTAADASFSAVGTATAGPRGGLRLHVAPEVTTRYRWFYPGDADTRASRSGVVRVWVRPVVTASAEPTRIDPGGSMTVSGLVTYEGAPYVGATVDLLARHPNRHARFRVVATGTTGALGEVSFVRSPTRTKVYRLLVRHTEGTPPRAVSDKFRVVVRTATSLSIRGRTTTTGFAVSGVLRGGGGPLPDRIVSLERLADDGVTWTAIDEARTRKRGKVRFLEPISEGAGYRLSFAGGRRFAPSVSGVVVN
jgi:hypothetical protein